MFTLYNFYLFQPYGISRPYQMEKHISILKVVGWHFFISIQIRIEHSVIKQWRT